MRPLWRCRACWAEWPCQPARLSLLVEYQRDRLALMMMLGERMAEASEQLTALTPSAPPDAGKLRERFLTWARARDGS